MNIDKIARICRDEKLLNQYKIKFAGRKVDVYFPKTSGYEDKKKLKEKIKNAFNKGLTIKELSIAFEKSPDTIRRYLDKKK